MTPALTQQLLDPAAAATEQITPAAVTEPDSHLSTELSTVKRRSPQHSGQAATIINLSKCFLGASTFELPWAFWQGGLIGSCVGLVVFALLSNASFSYLVSLSHSACPDIDRPTYPQLGRACLGAPGEMLVWFGMLAMTVGVVGSYLLFTGQIAADLLGQSQTLCVLVATLPGALLSLLRSTRLLSFTSAFGLASLAVACVAVMVDATTRPDVQLRPLRSYLTPAVRVSTFPLFLGNAAYLFLISTAVLPMEQQMEPAQRGSFRRCFSLAQLAVTVPNMAFALVACVAYSSIVPGEALGAADAAAAAAAAAAIDAGGGYGGYGGGHGGGGSSGINSNVMENLRPGALASVVKVFMAVNQLLTVPLFIIPMAESFERRLLSPAAFGTAAGERRRSAGRLLLCVASAGMALLVPNFGVLTGLTGAFGNNLLAFCFVPVFYFSHHYATTRWPGRLGWSRTAAEHALLLVLAAFGFALLGLSTTSTVTMLSGSS